MSPDAHSPLITRIVDALIRWRRILLVVALLATVAAWPIAQKLAFDQSIESLYAEKDPHLEDFKLSREQFGGDEFLIVAYVESDLFQPESNSLTTSANERITQFAERLNQVPGVAAKSTQHLAQALRFPYGRERARELSRGTLLGSDDQTISIVLRLLPEKKSPVPRGQTIADVRQLAAEHDPPAMVVGEPAQIHDMFRYVEDDGRKLFVVSLALLALVLLGLLQRLRWVVLPLLVVIVSLIWTEALLVLSGLRLSMVSSMLNSLMTIISVQTGMHVSLYFRDKHRELAPAEALRQSMVDLASPVWWTVTTTSFGFGVLVTSHINPVASFGLMMAIGSLVVMVAITVLLPGCVLMGRMEAEPPPSAADQSVAAALGRITLWVEHHPKQVIIASLALVAFAGAGFARLRVETDFSKNFRKHSPIVQSLEFVESHLGGAGSWEVNFPAPQELDTEFLDRVRAFAERLRTEFAAETDHIGVATDGKLSKVIAITDGLDLIPERFLLKTLSLETRLDLLSGLQREFVSSLYNPSARRMRLVLRAYERQPSETKLRLITDVERLAEEEFGDTHVVNGDLHGISTGAFEQIPTTTTALADAAPRAEDAQKRRDSPPKATGLFVLLAFLVESLMADQWITFFLSTVGITGMMWFAFRSFPIGLMSLVPNMFPNFLVIGLMGWIGLPINIATAMIACVSMGLTVDSSIIYIDGYHSARGRGLRVYEALHDTHRGVGRALVYSNVALMAGFSVLALSHFIPLIYFGLLVSLAMLGGLISNLVFLPLLIGLWDGRREQRDQLPQ